MSRGPRQKNRAVRFSVAAYRRMLVLYPERHRAEFGWLMAQLFQDQCRDAWNDSRFWGLLALWLRTMCDLLKTVCLEYLTKLKGNGFMFQQVSRNPRAMFVRAAALTFVLVYGSIVMLTMLSPKRYASCAVIEIKKNAPGQVNTHEGPDPYFLTTQMEILQSTYTLNEVVTNLNLDQIFAKRMGAESLNTAEAYNVLVSHLMVKQKRNTSFLEIWVYDSDKALAAEIANKVASVYAKYAFSKGMTVYVITPGTPGLRPVAPKTALNIVGGFALSLTLASLLGTAMGFGVWLWPRIPTTPRGTTA